MASYKSNASGVIFTDIDEEVVDKIVEAGEGVRLSSKVEAASNAANTEIPTQANSPAATEATTAQPEKSKTTTKGGKA